MSELRGTIGLAAAFFFMLCVNPGLRVLTPQELGGPVVRLEEAWYDLGDLGAVALRSGQAPPLWRSQDFVDGDRVVLFGGWVLGTTTDPLGEDVAPPVDGAPTAYRALGRKVPVNHATQAELEALPGIGPTLAQRIIAGRPYHRLEDLDRVKGIGPKTLEKLGKWLELSP
jgi:competence ComEA-like helix-hairpin-helix protein